MKGIAERLESLREHVLETYPYYKRLPVRPERFQDLPFIDKQIINQNRMEFELTGETGLIESFTSGTTGVAFRCLKSRKEALQLSLGLFAHRKKWGLPIRHRMLLLSNRLLSEPRLLSHYAEKIRIENPHMIQGRMSALVKLADFLAPQGYLKGDALCFVQNWGEPVHSIQKRKVEQAFGVPVVDYYGLEELWCIAFSDMDGKLVVDENLVFLEVIDRDSGKPLEDGEYGEIIVTSLIMRTIPFVRYRTGDIGSLSREASGRLVLTLLPVRSSQIKLPDRSIHPAVFRYLDRFFYELSITNDLEQYQIVQEDYYTFRILIVTRGTHIYPGLEQKLALLLGQMLRQQVDMKIEPVATIEPHPVSGKIQSFISYVS
jgi:phenylacetate-CoA ligase